MTAFLLTRGAGPVLALFLGTMTVAAQDGAKPCSCKNLESLQQDYQNALYLEAAFDKLATELREYEARDLAKGVSRSETDRFGDQFYEDVVKIITKEMPFSVAGYTGPKSVPMPPGTCEQDPALLDALAKGSVCAGMADPALVHEFEHRELCKSMGADAYWSRFSSELAAEEAERYKNQAANLKNEIKRVLDDSEIKLRGEWRHVLAGGGATITYFYEFESGDLKLASEGGDRWTFSGEGETQNSLESMKVPEVICTSNGAVRNKFTVSMDTDGLTFGLDYLENPGATDMKITCKAGKGSGMGMAIPSGGGSSGRLVSSQPLVAGDNRLPNAWADAIMALAASEGMSVTGEPKTTLSLTCEAP